MSKWETRLQQIIESEIGKTDRRVFLVEGPDDVKTYRYFFEKKLGSEWEQKWLLTYAGKKTNVLEMLKQRTDWLGLVDRDEWSDDTVETMQHQIPNLLVLPRFCMESYFSVPVELWDALPEKQKSKISGGFKEFIAEILFDHIEWVRHGVLWSVINPMWGGLRELGFVQELLDRKIAQDDQAIKERLQAWHEYLYPDEVFQKFQQLHEKVSQETAGTQIKRWIHGKHFWHERINPALTRWFGQADEETRRIQLCRGLPVPQDWDFIWERMK